MVALPLVPIVIGGAIKLAAPHVAKFLVKHGFKKASQTAVKGKTKIPKVSSKQAKDIVNKNQQTRLDRIKDNLIKYPEAEHLTKGYQELHRLGKIKTDQLKVFRKELEKRYGDKFANYSDDQLTELSKHMNKLLYKGPLATETAVTSKVGRKALSQKAKKMNGGSRNRKRGGRVGRPKGVGKALRGYGKAMKRGKH